MKIFINALPYFSYQGIENFLTNLLRAWPENSDDDITVLANEISVKFLPALPQEIKIEIIKFRKINKLSIFLFQQLKLSRLLKQRKTDLLFCASLNCPWLYPKKIVTIHDAAPFIIKNESGCFGKTYWRASLFFAKYFSRCIITVSEFSRQELINKLKIQPDRIKIIYNGSPIIPPVDYAQKQKNISHILTIGNARARKNLKVLFDAHALVTKELPNLHLKVVGKMDEKMKILAHSYQSEKIEFTGFIKDEDKYQLLRQAQALIFPSLYEGFGLPILEAQAMQVPVICSDIPAFKEIAGKSALFFNPLSASDLAEKIKKIIKDQSLVDNLRIQGKKNCSRFDWQESAKKLSAIIHLYENSANK